MKKVAMDGQAAVARVFAAYDYLAMEKQYPRIALLPDLAEGIRLIRKREQAGKRLSKHKSGWRYVSVDEMRWVEGHAARGAIALASLFRGGVGEPDVWLLAHGGPRSLDLLKQALNGNETVGRTAPLRCITRTCCDLEDWRIEIKEDGGENTSREVHPPKNTPNPTMEDIEKQFGSIGELFANTQGLGLLNLYDQLVEAIAGQDWVKRIPVILVDTVAPDPKDIDLSGKTKILDLIYGRLVALSSRHPDRTVVSISDEDLDRLAKKAGLEKPRQSSKHKPQAQLKVVKALAKRLSAPILFHSARCAALIRPDGSRVIVPTFRIEPPPTNTNGSGDTFNAAFLAAKVAMVVLSEIGNPKIEVELTDEDCLLFACAAAGARCAITSGGQNHTPLYASKTSVLQFSSASALRDLKGIIPLRVLARNKLFGPGRCYGPTQCFETEKTALLAASNCRRRFTGETRRVVLIDLDHTLFPSADAREHAGAQALAKLEPCEPLTYSERVDLFRCVYDNELELRPIFGKKAKDLRLHWNHRQFYQLAYAIAAGFAPDAWLAFVKSKRDRNTNQQRKSNGESGVQRSLAGFIECIEATLDDLDNGSQTQEMSKQIEEAVAEFTRVGYYPYAGVRGAIEALTALPGMEVYCLVEGCENCQWKKIQALGLADLIPESRLLVEDKMLVEPQHYEAIFSHAIMEARSLTISIQVVKQKHAEVRNLTQTSFRSLYLGAICVDPSAPQQVAQHLKAKAKLEATRPIQVAIIGDKTNPELDWFYQAVASENNDHKTATLIGLDEPPTAKLYKVSTGSYAHRTVPRQMAGLVKSVPTLVDALAELAFPATWNEVKPIIAVSIPTARIVLSKKERAHVMMARTSAPTSVRICAEQVLANAK